MHFLRYTILVLTGVLFSFLLKGQGPVTINIGSGSGSVGDIVCVDFTGVDFENAVAMEWFNRWDPSVLRLESVDVTNSALNTNSSSITVGSNFNTMEGTENFGKVTWIDNGAVGITIADNALIYTLCFELIGEPCESSFVTIADGDNPVLFQVGIGNDETTEIDVNINPGVINILPDGFTTSTSFCGSEPGNPTGSITFATGGGQQPYSWNIIGPGGFMADNLPGEELGDCESETIMDLEAGTYTITFTDANGEVRMEIVEIVSNSDFPFLVELIGNDPTCFDRLNGSIEIDQVIGGEEPYTFMWSNFQSSPDMIEDLDKGTYSVTVTDDNGCTTSAVTSIDVDTVRANINIISNPSCDGGNNGVVSIFAEGGTPGPNGRYVFDIEGIDTTTFNGGSFSQLADNPWTQNNYPEGCFQAVVEDDLGCESDPVEFCLEEGQFASLLIVTNDVTCFGDCDGTVFIDLPPGSNFVFLVTDEDGNTIPGANSNTQYNTDDLCPGLYDVNIRDLGAGCEKDTFFMILEPDLLQIAVVDSMGPGCGGNEGFIDLQVSGGNSGGFTINWNDGFMSLDRENLSGGNYGVTVTDMNECADSLSFSFTNGGTTGLEAVVCQSLFCASQDDASICASVTAMGSFTFSWENEDGTSLGDGEQIDNVGPGTYIVTATDGMCTSIDTVVVDPGINPAVDIVFTTPMCPTSNDGSLSASLVEGASPGMFEWTMPPSTTVVSSGQVVFGMAGDYNLMITDANGCTADTLVSLLPPTDSIEVNFNNIQAVECFNECNGSANLIITGGPAGLGDYTVFANGSPVAVQGGSITIDNLCAGENIIFVTDGLCGTGDLIVTIPDAEQIMIDIDNSIILPPSCNDTNDGRIEIEIIGGNDASFDIFWIDEGVMGNVLTDLVGGEYVAQITDANGCVVNDTVNLEAVDPLLASVNPFSTIDVTCATLMNGRINIDVTGGNPGPLDFNWDPLVSVSGSATDLSEGIYNVTVTDLNGCSVTLQHELMGADPIIAVVDAPASPDCFGGTTNIGISSVSGGIGNDFTFTINNGPRISVDTFLTVFAGPYLINVFDSTGCGVDTMINITQPSEIIVDAGPDITIDLGETSDPNSIFIVSEENIDSIIWTPMTNIECNTPDCQVVTFSGGATQEYTVTVIDENGCTDSDDILVSVDLARNVFTPNIFSPNNDNRNDLFQLVVGNGVQNVDFFRVYDRYGNLMYEDENYVPDGSLTRGWDGLFNNQEVETGVYVYIATVRFIDGEVIQFRGDVTLLR